METFIPHKHAEVKEVRRYANQGNYSKTMDCYLNGDLALIPEDEALRILSLSYIKRLEYMSDLEIPTMGETKEAYQERYSVLEQNLIDINFGAKGLKQVVEKLYNENIWQKKHSR